VKSVSKIFFFVSITRHCATSKSIYNLSYPNLTDMRVAKTINFSVIRSQLTPPPRPNELPKDAEKYIFNKMSCCLCRRYHQTDENTDFKVYIHSAVGFICIADYCRYDVVRRIRSSEIIII